MVLAGREAVRWFARTNGIHRQIRADHTVLAHPEVQAVTAGGKVLDPVHRSGLDPGGQHPAGGAGCFGGDRFDEDLPSGRFVGGGDDVVVGEVQQKRCSVEWPGILEHGS